MADLNGDGWPDLFVLNLQGHGHYFENQGGHTFVDKTAEYFPRTPWGAMGIKFFDFDNDAVRICSSPTCTRTCSRPCRLAVKSRRPASIPPSSFWGGTADTFIFGNALFHNISTRGRTAFEQMSERAGVENYWPGGRASGT